MKIELLKTKYPNVRLQFLSLARQVSTENRQFLLYIKIKLLLINEIYIWGEKLLCSHFPPICQGGKNGYIAIFPGGNLLYSHFSTYSGKEGKCIFPGGMAMG